MKKWTILPAGLGLLLALATVQADQENRAEDGRGRYEGVAASENAVWVVDTRTGKVRKCTQEFSDQTPDCSAFSR